MSGGPEIGHRIKTGTIRILLTAVAFLITFLGINSANAQILYGSLRGTVADKTGAVIPGVVVTITNQGTGAVRTTNASGQGEYEILDLMPGAYTVSVQRAANFAGYSEKNVQIEINRQVRVDITLQAAAVTTLITVNDAPPELQTETAEVNHEISQTEIAQLPITSSQGRSFQALYTVIPGTGAVAEGNSTASNPSRAMDVNVNGTSFNGNTTRIDGAVNYYGWLPYLIAYVPPADSIENVSFTTNSFNAEQGQAGGASVKITTKSGTKNFHGSAWEYYQGSAFNARAYTATKASLISPTNPNGSVPKNIFDQFGFNIGGPVYIPRILTGKQKLFFFQNFERTTRRQLITNTLTVPDINMIGGNFSEAVGNTVLYDPAPTVGPGSPTSPLPAADYVNGYLLPAYRPSFTAEYSETGNNINTIPASRIAFASQIMMTDLQANAALVAPPTQALIGAGMANDQVGSGTFAYNRNTSDSKITYIMSENTQIFGKYSVEPFSVDDPQELGSAGGGTFDGGQPGAAAGRIQNVGLGASHIITSNLVLDADFGYTRQVTGAQSTLDLLDKDYGLDVLKIPGTNSGTGPNYYGQPIFSMNSTFNTLGNASGANPFLFRDNQFTGDVNLSWVKGKHSTKYGFTYYHFDLNHFQPTSGANINGPRGGFLFSGNMTCGGNGTTCGVSAYTDLADLLLGLPSNGGTNLPAVATAAQVFNPNSLRWSEFGVYAQDQWAINQKMTIDYGVRYEIYPAPYRNHTGVFVLDPTLPQSGNVEVGGVGGNPENAGINAGHGYYAPRLGITYRLNSKTVIRSGGGFSSDPDAMRYLRDAFPEDLNPNYSGSGVGTIAIDPANTSAYASGQPMTLTYGIPTPVIPNYTSGFASLPVSSGTNTVRKDFRRGYLESWNFFVERDLGSSFVANVGYVGNHFVRQQAGVQPYNSAPLTSGSTPCMANGQYNPSTGLSGPCNTQANETINQQFCSGANNPICYNSGGITINMPIFSSMYDALQSQLTRNAGKNASLGVVYTWSHAFDYEDNGAGSGAGGTTFNYPAYYFMNKAQAGFDRTHNLQIWGIYSLPFGHGQKFANHGIADAIIGGFQLNGQLSHISGAPFSVSANSNTLNTPGMGALYGQLIAPYQQEGGHNRVAGSTAVSGGKPWFNPASFSNPFEPTYTATETPGEIAPVVIANTRRNEFRGPGQSVVNASIFRAFHLYRESEFQARFEAFNVFNHPLLNNPNLSVAKASQLAATPPNYGTLGMITSFGNTRSLQLGGRFNF